MVSVSKTTLIATAALAASFAAAAADVRELLERMERSLATRNYQGTFIHEHDGQSETLRIVHRASGGDAAERIASLDGSGREVIRRNGELRAYFPDQQVVLVDSAPKEALLFPDLLHLDSAAAQMYRLSEEAPTRISGRRARVLAILPQDDLRYGYRIWIDEASAMPLKTQLRTSTGRVVEQLVFAELTLPTHIADAALQPAMGAHDYRWIRPEGVTAAAAGPAPDTTWDASELPPGFRLTANSTQMFGGGRTAVTHLVFSDGLASVSVFVEPESAAVASPRPSVPATMTNLASSSALSIEVDGRKVTAIGEVPPATVRAIAGSLRAGFAPAARAGTGIRR